MFAWQTSAFHIAVLILLFAGIIAAVGFGVWLLIRFTKRP